MLAIQRRLRLDENSHVVSAFLESSGIEEATKKGTAGEGRPGRRKLSKISAGDGLARYFGRRGGRMMMEGWLAVDAR